MTSNGRCGRRYMTYVFQSMEAWNNLDNYHFQEKAIDKLFFELCPNNNVRSDILLKVSTLNDFYSTNIFSPYSVAKGAVKKMNSQQKAISKTEENELLEVHKLLKKYGVRSKFQKPT